MSDRVIPRVKLHPPLTPDEATDLVLKRAEPVPRRQPRTRKEKETQAAILRFLGLHDVEEGEPPVSPRITRDEAAAMRAEQYRCPCVGSNDPRCSFPDCAEGDES